MPRRTGRGRSTGPEREQGDRQSDASGPSCSTASARPRLKSTSTSRLGYAWRPGLLDVHSRAAPHQPGTSRSTRAGPRCHRAMSPEAIVRIMMKPKVNAGIWSTTTPSRRFSGGEGSTVQLSRSSRRWAKCSKNRRSTDPCGRFLVIRRACRVPVFPSPLGRRPI